MRRLEVSGPARQDLRRLEVWLIERGADEAGRRLALSLKDELAALPRLADRSHKRRADDSCERLLSFGRSTYVVRYRFDEDVVRVLRIHHGREDRTA